MRSLRVRKQQISRGPCYSVSIGPSTPATRLLRDRGVPFTEHLYRYEERGGTHLSARALGVDEHAVVKMLIVYIERSVFALDRIHV